MPPLISVMIPCYNAAKTLPLALASLLAQTYTEWECILVDDGSTDQPDKVIEVVNDPRIHYVRFEQNRGRAAARQQALDLARGEYLCMLDADDWIYPHKLERQLAVMEQEPDLAVLSTGMAIVDGENEIVGVRSLGSRSGSITRYPPLVRPIYPPFAHGPSMIRRKEAKQNHYDLSLRVTEDVDYLLRIILQAPFAVLADITYAYAEIESVTPDKIKQGLRNGRRMLRKYRAAYPRPVYIGLAKSYLKEAAYRTCFALDLHSMLIGRRSGLATAEMISEFHAARDIVYKTSLSTFAGTSFLPAMVDPNVKTTKRRK